MSALRIEGLRSALSQLACSLLLWGTLAGCSTLSSEPDLAAAASPSLSPAPPGRPALSRQDQLAALGYVEEEFVLRGQARRYARDGSWGDDGHWAVKPRSPLQGYETRILVRRPKSPARFNGAVVVEWLNTSLVYELDGGWMLTRDEVLREGYAWVGVSAEPGSDTSLKKLNGARYGHVKVDSSDLAYDIYTQAGGLIRQLASQWGIPSASTGGSVRLLSLGYSQSGSYLKTYINAFHAASRNYDGFLIMAPADVSMPINLWDFAVISPRYRLDLSEPVLQVSNEMEVMIGWGLSKTPDTDKLRHWEIAGASHFDKYMQEETLAGGRNEGKLAMPQCFRPSNALPARMFEQAALSALRKWVLDGTPPPLAPRMQRNGLGFVKNDEFGNVLGGLRLPDLDVPIAHYGMYSNFPTHAPGFWVDFACMSSGSTVPLDADTLRARYPSDQAYFQAYKQGADKLLNDGFLRPADHAKLLERARAVKLAH
jgi:hypothetical protein